MGLLARIRARLLGRDDAGEAGAQAPGARRDDAGRTASTPPSGSNGRKALPDDGWELLSPYIPIDSAERPHVVAIAAALAAGDHPRSEFELRSLSVANPEFQLVSCIASALAAGALDSSAFRITHIYKKRTMEEAHAA